MATEVWLFFLVVFPLQYVSLWTTGFVRWRVSAPSCWMLAVFIVLTLMWFVFLCVLKLGCFAARRGFLLLYSCCGAGVWDSCGAPLLACDLKMMCWMAFAQSAIDPVWRNIRAICERLCEEKKKLCNDFIFVLKYRGKIISFFFPLKSELSFLTVTQNWGEFWGEN